MERPWIQPENASIEAIKTAIDRCPSGALGYVNNDIAKVKITESSKTEITITLNGPLHVKGDFSIINSNGDQTEQKERVALCRCGQSANKPFCDGSHKATGFEG